MVGLTTKNMIEPVQPTSEPITKEGIIMTIAIIAIAVVVHLLRPWIDKGDGVNVPQR